MDTKELTSAMEELQEWARKWKLEAETLGQLIILKEARIEILPGLPGYRMRGKLNTDDSTDAVELSPGHKKST